MGWRACRTPGASPKRRATSAAGRSRASAIERPRQRTSSTSGRKRRPSQAPHFTKASGRNCISTFSYPAPSHTGHAPAAELNEKEVGLRPRSRASGVFAKTLRSGSRTPM